MEIIKNNATVRVTCPHCKSVLGVCKKDIRVVEFSTDYVMCAVCGKSIDISMSQIPQHWRCSLYKDCD